MAKNFKPIVTLFYDLVDDRYHVEQIRGNVVGIQIVHGREPITVRVGSVLSEAEATALGRMANLTIKRYTI